MELMLNITTGDDNPYDKKVNFDLCLLFYCIKSCNNFQGDKNSKTHYSGSGFLFEFNSNEPAKATVIARKRTTKAKTEEIGESQTPTETFKLTTEPEKPEGKQKKSKQQLTEPSVILDEVLKNDKRFDIPKQLPTVDFMDEPKKNNKKFEKRNNDKPVRDFTNVPAKRTEKPQKKPKNKFSKVSNPFPNDPSKKLAKNEDNVKSRKSPEKEKIVNESEELELEVEEMDSGKKKKGSDSKKSTSESKKSISELKKSTHESKKPAPEPESPAPESKKQKHSKKSQKNFDTGSDNTNVFTTDHVDSLKIHPFSIKNMKDVLNFHKLTHVQQKSIPAALEGKDLLIRSPTGSGKTLSYALPIVEKLVKLEPKLKRSDGIHALVIVPTRELAVQTYELFVKLVKPFQWIVPGYLSGGEKRKAEKSRLRNGITILISTPGRICDHLLHTESMKFDKIQIFALDEADRLLELGYENDVKKVVDTIAEQNKDSRPIQKILLSATLTAKVKQLAGLTLSEPVYVDNDTIDNIKDSMLDIETDDNIAIPVGIDQKYFMVPPKLRFIVLCSLLVTKVKRGAKKILIFFPTQNVVDYSYDIMVEFLTQPFRKKEKSAKSYLNDNDDDLDAMLSEQEESDDEDEGNIWLPNVTFFK